jgi:amidase
LADATALAAAIADGRVSPGAAMAASLAAARARPGVVARRLDQAAALARAGRIAGRLPPMPFPAAIAGMPAP